MPHKDTKESAFRYIYQQVTFPPVNSQFRALSPDQLLKMSRYYLISGSNDVNGSTHPTLNGSETVTLALNASPSHVGSVVGGTGNKKHRIIEHKDGEIIISESPNEATIEATTESDDGTTTITLPGDLFANYSTNMWDRDADGNKIAVQVIKQDSAQELLNQAIKPETTENGHVDIQTITIPGNAQQSASNISPAATTQVIVGASNSSGNNIGNATGSGTIVLQPSGQFQKVSTNPRVIIADDAPVPRGSTHSTKQNGTEDRPHVCDVCNKGFVKREHLTKHLRIHKSDNKRYSCEYCQKAFRDRYELVRHTRRHTGDFPFR